ncbi:PREDICTED: carboxylesterase 1C isoform X1 [Rhagoletis zephyria]|uniref:carboxylesterase 1C isoform X1 n=1 Tax=Rhagoletis zephyria TaxID=28612 RepID=UPI000811A0FC|nr:PREDICTED: carboxylesterase 1C isoform X1 [Rhagoletis zephyria]
MQLYWLPIAFIFLEHLYANGQHINILLEQGPIIGLKIFPDSSRTAVYAFLGVPYAQPPIADLRFMPPLAHRGWNRTLTAMNMRPLCPQPSNTIYDEKVDGTLPRAALMDEDCLYLNIWVSEAVNTGQKPVLVLITGENMVYDWSQNRVSGVDFALENVVVVSMQYRSNIFGWIALDNGVLAGNLGLQDQQLALHWIQHNIQHFGGDPKRITLLGHGTSGAPCALAHALAKTADEPKLVSKLILMSSGDFMTSLNTPSRVVEASNVLVSKLGCQFERPSAQLARCLKLKSVSDLLNAFESVYDHGNGTLHIGPILPADVDDFLRNVSVSSALPPILCGITSNEGAFLQQHWLNLAREGYQAIRDYVNFTLIPSVLQRFHMEVRNKVKYVLNWFYFSGDAGSSVKSLLYSMQRLISEYFFELPFYRTLNVLASRNSSDVPKVYAYVFDASNSMDIRGKVNWFGGASHTSDLLLLLGPSMFQQISRRRLTTAEDRISRKFRKALINFIKSDMAKSTSSYEPNDWLPYTNEHQFVKYFGETEKLETRRSYFLDFAGNVAEIEKMLQNGKEIPENGLSRTNRNDRRGIDNGQSKLFLKNQTDFGYAAHLKRVASFWQIFIPNVPVYEDQSGYDNNNVPLGQRKQLKEATADAVRYRKGFFVLLSLIAALLSVLALCVYILHRDHIRERSHTSVFRL